MRCSNFEKKMACAVSSYLNSIFEENVIEVSELYYVLFQLKSNFIVKDRFKLHLKNVTDAERGKNLNSYKMGMKKAVNVLF